MDKIENEKSEAEEVKVPMLENTNGAGEIKDANLNTTKPQYTRKQCKGSEGKLKVNQKKEFLLANKGLIITVVISALIIFAVVVAMLATRESKGHGHGHGHSKVYNATSHN